jgi:hypothetical protein
MDTAGKITEVLLYFIPAALVLMAAFLLIKKFLDNDYKLRILDLKRTIQKETIPLRLQAYERLTLYLERISPNNLLVRSHRSGMSAREFHTELLTVIRTEYEHNLSQQIYMSNQSWEMVKRAREETVRMIGTAFALVGENGSGIELSKTIFEMAAKINRSPVDEALNTLKNEVKQIL